MQRDRGTCQHQDPKRPSLQNLRSLFGPNGPPLSVYRQLCGGIQYQIVYFVFGECESRDSRYGLLGRQILSYEQVFHFIYLFCIYLFCMYLSCIYYLFSGNC